ncbi:terminase small subunit [Staphylococcus pseudintermedius]|uniref:terminase small subunit n=1 Tax=Staphylococcus pseudintermedius TaxID=283734 RepID=UPI00055F35BC|nr:terminase small subunit [Staphylococcus pseudintermedius]ANQ88974.1 terminase [Staphylococcus pseudintermedius]EGQ0367456.1 terminase small subunit [Staphylococcus pseudintermedius]EGQ2852588.1 terminase small subunit [Staphylococcus pseudintermedius]EGQ2895305.1 terminase small subunit [Staphylococcus pseudintermedius]EGQ2923584.1 terminase small subunit [Staphylococcus pseudintermedius]
MKLTIKQERLVDEYVKTGNAYQSAINAGYSKSYARVDVHKVLAKPRIKQAIDNRLAQLKKESIADQDEILQYLTSVMRGESTEQILRNVGEGYQDIDNIDVGAKDRIKAAELLGKRYMMWNGKQVESQESKLETLIKQNRQVISDE